MDLFKADFTTFEVPFLINLQFILGTFLSSFLLPKPSFQETFKDILEESFPLITLIPPIVLDLLKTLFSSSLVPFRFVPELDLEILTY